jgi:hypothetical protein
MKKEIKQLQEKARGEFNKQFIDRIKDINGGIAYSEWKYKDDDQTEEVAVFLDTLIAQTYKAGQEDEAVKHQKEDINVRKEMKEEISDAYKRGYNKRLEDEGKTGERWQHLYL